MKTKFLLVGMAFLASAITSFAHEHFAAGVDNLGTLVLYTESNQQLSPTSDTVYHLVWRDTGVNYGGYYSLDEFPREEYPNDYFVFTALSDGQAELDGPNHAPTGSDIWIQITSVSGPDGGHFGFWDTDASYFSTTPTASFLVNASTGGFKFELSEPIGDGDPFGHIHDRGFTVDQPGDYYVAFTLYDMSGAGPDGGPLAATSQNYTFHLVAVPEPCSIALLVVAIGLAGIARQIVKRRSRKIA